MSAPESIFSTTGIEGPTQNTSAESLDPKTKTAAAALFVSIMEQYAPSQSSKMEPWGARWRSAADGQDAALAGKNLPALPEAMPSHGAPLLAEPALLGQIRDGNVVSARLLSDDALEEFAVDLGIDRDLARLLLRETTTAGDPLREAIAEASEPTPAPALQIDVSPALNAAAQSERATMEFGKTTSPLEGSIDTRTEASAETLEAPTPMSVSIPLSNNPLANNPLANNFSSDEPLADEDVLRWRAAGARVVSPDPVPDTGFKPLGIDALRGVPTVRGSSDESAPAPSAQGVVPKEASQFTVQAPVVGSAMGSAVAPAMGSAAAPAMGSEVAPAMGSEVAPAMGSPAPVAVSPSAEVARSLPNPPAASVVILPSVGLVAKESVRPKESPTLNTTLTVKDSDEPIATIQAVVQDGVAADDPIDALKTAAISSASRGDLQKTDTAVQVAPLLMTSDAWLSLNSRQLRQQSEGGLSPTSAVAPAAGAWVSAATPVSSAFSNVLDPAAAANRPLPLPSSTLDYDTRAEQFAEQVGQRLIQQMRADRWSVSIQLDPQNLGPLDIALEINGSDVRANLAVMSADVRALLESGMPRLRETLESAGYQLSDWSLADSAGRDPAAQQQFAHAELTQRALQSHRNDDVTNEINVTSSLSDRSNRERGIDLYV
jgi:flagellar hook-length control protein FliK